MEQTIKTTKITRSFVGTVLSTSAQKTLVVKVDTMKMHTKYHKQYRVSRKYHAHDEKSVAKVGDVVEISACRPLSALKHWRLVRIVKSSK
ncbi:MAG: 30S ribosomal protein S17 [Candidatus Magasanikbacteria bacterium RIFOXYC2_FULL_42_28]|uniref:Small ribosomal subunit protein uS17 n=1 Tax=Candidatus Magasanikbacteria bacterium RIFOXYC2_FULL_42_28 TaxID=1798704 RepID=A0A1F6NUU6_9BACT|nr:MAG: 30S ribosomal protein S17 [Candidatus Magasanikbacteria bacterium RIFOXYC2_FULL_42_28]